MVFGVELSLQAAAVAVWFANRPEPRHLVLCVGDSYTFGTGATGSEFSYPSALERLLHKEDRSWQVVNAGWPDRDSRDTRNKFLSYPMAGDGNLNDVLRRVANEKRVGLVDVEATFKKRLETTPRQDLFAPDGHLINKGYALVADLVANDIQRRKR